MTKVVYFGNERLVSGLDKTDAPLLRGLIENGYDVVAVVSHHTSSTSRNQRRLEVAEIAKEHNIPVFLPDKPAEIRNELRTLNADIAVLAAYGRIIGQQIIDIFPFGIVNLHPSLLPQYRGPTPIESIILNDDKVAGISVMKLTAGMDEGPLYAQTQFHLKGSCTKLALYWRISVLGANLLLDTLPRIIDGSLIPKPQNDTQVSYSKLIQKSDGVIDWRKSADQIAREIRAYADWPQSRTKLGNVEVIITSANATGPFENTGPGQLHVIYNQDVKTLFVGTGEGQLEIDKVKPLGKKEMPIEAFLSGYKDRLFN